MPRARPGNRYGWKPALGVSIVLHAGAVLGLTVLFGDRAPGPSPAAVHLGGSLILAGDDGETYLLATSDGEESSAPLAPAAMPPAPVEEPTVSSPPQAIVGPPASIGSSPASLPGAPAPGGSGPAGEGQRAGAGATTHFFGVEARGTSVVYLIDCSASMGLNRRLAAARRELLTSLLRLPPTARFQVIVYHSHAAPLLPARPDWLAPTPETLRQVAEAVRTLNAEGKTEHTPALRRALALQPDVLFFLTDADDLTAEQLRLATLLARGKTAIHTLELNRSNRARPEMPMQVLARTTGGVYRAVDLDAAHP